MTAAERWGLIAACVVFGTALGVLLSQLPAHVVAWLAFGVLVATGLSLYVIFRGGRR